MSPPPDATLEQSSRYITAHSYLLQALFVTAMLLLGSCSKKVVVYTGPDSPPQQQLSAADSTTEKALRTFYRQWEGTPYRLGRTSRSAIDCSGLTYTAYRELFDLTLPRTVSAQVRLGKTVSPRSLQPGDLVFFKTGFWQRHVGIYFRDNTFIHASTSKGVTVSALHEPYWRSKFWKARRLVQ